MQIMKLALPLAGLLMAGGALAHKASHAAVTAAAPARLLPAQTDTNPVALLEGIGGRSARGAMAEAAATPQERPAKSSASSIPVNRIH